MKNKNPLLKFQIISVIFTGILGTLLHFTYEWSNQNILIGVFSAINESTWEHLKLAFYPMLITTIIGYFLFKDTRFNFLCAKMIGILFTLSFIIIFFYTYSGIIGKDISILSIGSFFVSIILGEYLAYKIVNSDYSCDNSIAIIVLILLFVCFVSFTFFPPKIGLFKDPLTNTFGIFKSI